MISQNRLGFAFLAGLTVFCAGSALGQEKHLFSQAKSRAHILFLASDELAGRKTGEPGNDRAAAYIAEQFRKAGLEELPGAPQYLQAIDLVRIEPAEAGMLTLEKSSLSHGGEMVVLTGMAANFAAKLQDVGHGWVDTLTGHDDYRGLDISGKIAVAEFGLPGRGAGPSAFAASSVKRQQAYARGAIAVIEWYRGRFPWSGLVRFLNRSNLRRAGGDGFSEADGRLVHLIVNDPDSLYGQMELTGRTAQISTSGRRVVEIQSSNVAGRIVGADPTLRREHVILSAHYDHMGIVASRGAADADTIMNGARDNGMGTVALIAAAKLLAANPPKRSVLLLAVTGEELGLIGSRYYVDHPLVPLEQSVFNLNVDAGGVTDTSIVTVVGLERTNAAEAIRAGCWSVGLQVIPDPVPEQNLFNRSDNVSFARLGIPAPTFSPGFRDFGAELQKFYHQPGDEADEHFPFRYLWRFSRAYAEAARQIANLAQRPAWSPGDEYEGAYRRLFQVE